MKSHGDLEALLMIEEMVEVIGVLAHIDLHPVHLAIETVAAVISGDAATGFEANIEGFVGRRALMIFLITQLAPRTADWLHRLVRTYQ